MNAESGRGAIGLVILAAACWGLGTVITKAVLSHMPPLTLLVIQLTVSVTFLWALVLALRVPLKFQRELVRLGVAGWLNPGLAYTFGLIGLTMTTASMSSLIWAAEPVLILGLAWLFLGDRLTPSLAGLSAVAAAGAVMVIGSGSTSGDGGTLAGNLLVVTAVLCCAIYTVLSRRSVEKVHSLLLAAVQQSVSLVWALLIWSIELRTGVWGDLATLAPAVWFWAVISGLVYYALAFWFYIVGLKQMPASVAGQFLNFIPIFGLAGAFLLLGERLVPVQWWGALLILTAVVGISRLSRTEQTPSIGLKSEKNRSLPVKRET